MFTSHTLYKVIVLLLGNEVLENYKEDYDSRLLIQKAVYMLQEFIGKELYNFSWYISGPYSSSLSRQITEEILDNIDEIQKEANNIELTKRGKEYIKKVQEFFEVDNTQLKQVNLTKADWYELLASMYYLFTRFGISNQDDLEKSIKENKRRFSEEQVKFVIDEFHRRYCVLVR